MKKRISYLDSYFRDNFNIDEMGMTLIPEHRSIITNKLQLLEERAPVESFINFKLINMHNKTKGILSITGLEQNFKAELYEEHPLVLFKMLETEIDSQLLKWKKKRFTSNYTQPRQEVS